MHGTSSKTLLDYPDLFHSIQMAEIFADSKTATDCIPTRDLDTIYAEFLQLSTDNPNSLSDFVQANFAIPTTDIPLFETQAEATPLEHIDRLWEYLTREIKEPLAGSTYVPLPYPFVVPGGRFQEIYYWDSYFTLLGLKKSGKWEVMEQMIANFAYLIRTYGFIPNGNRTYFLSRSQPPFFSLMIDLLPEEKQIQFLPELEKEYLFWMQSPTDGKSKDFQRVVEIALSKYLNRYWDNSPTPRPESYREDIALATQNPQRKAEDIYLDLRAACESGWDFSSRWLADNRTLGTIETTRILPVDLNCLLYKLEQKIAALSALQKQTQKADTYTQLAAQRATLIQNLFWDEEEQFFCDYHWVNGKSTRKITLAGLFPLWVGLASSEQIACCAHRVEKDLLTQGGVRTTMCASGQQWDAPNGWAPLQWIAVASFQGTTFSTLGEEIKVRWMDWNTRIFNEKGKFTEKYNVESTSVTTGGGEYPNQDGFGWTNGVYSSFTIE